MTVMLVKLTRLNNIVISFCKGEHITEKRGGYPKSGKLAEKKQLIRSFIKKLLGKETHYSIKKKEVHLARCQSKCNKVVENVQRSSI